MDCKIELPAEENKEAMNIEKQDTVIMTEEKLEAMMIEEEKIEEAPTIMLRVCYR